MNKIKDLLWAFKQNKKAQLAVGIVFILILVALAGYFYFAGQEDNNLDGKLTTQEKQSIDVSSYPVAIVVENLQSVRPQAGLSEADVVYETLAEGGITRFLAVYNTENNIPEIGPVRSARKYFVDWSEEYRGLFAHVGGSPESLSVLNSEEYLIDVNQFFNSGYFWRDENIPAPHNLMTSSEKMSFAIRDLVEEGVNADYEAWLTKDSDAADYPEAESIVLDFSSDSYKVEWKYDADENNYLRFNADEEQKDRNNDEQIKADNILVQYTEASLQDNEGRLDIETLGSGDMILFQDGNVVTGTWKKTAREDRTKFYDQNDEEVELNEGITWVEVIPEDREVTY